MRSEITVLTFDCYGTLIDWERGILATDYSVKNKTEKNMPSTFQFLFQTSDGHASNAAQAFRRGTRTRRYPDTGQCRHDELRCFLYDEQFFKCTFRQSCFSHGRLSRHRRRHRPPSGKRRSGTYLA